MDHDQSLIDGTNNDDEMMMMIDRSIDRSINRWWMNMIDHHDFVVVDDYDDESTIIVWFI